MLKFPLSAAPVVFAAKCPEFQRLLWRQQWWAGYPPKFRPGRKARNERERRLPDCLIFESNYRFDKAIIEVELDTGRVIALTRHRGVPLFDTHIYRLVSDPYITNALRRESLVPDLSTLWRLCICLFLEQWQVQAPFFRITGRIKGTNSRPDIPNSVWERLQYYESEANDDHIDWYNNVVKTKGDIYVGVRTFFYDKLASKALKNSELFDTLNHREAAAYLFLVEILDQTPYVRKPLHIYFEQLRSESPTFTVAEFWQAWRAACETRIRGLKSIRVRLGLTEFPIARGLTDFPIARGLNSELSAEALANFIAPISED